MKNCLKCKYAEWDRTKTNRLHPSGDGKCKYPYKVPQIPASMRWFNIPSPHGGFINRHEELREHCIYYKENQK